MIRIHASELLRLADTPMPWWDRNARALLGLVVPGSPTAEVTFVDEDDTEGTATGWYLLSYPNSARDEYVLEVIRKRWEILDGEDTAQHAVVEAHIDNDWDAWEDLMGSLQRGSVTQAQAVERVWAYITAMGAQIGIPYVPPVEPEGN